MLFFHILSEEDLDPSTIFAIALCLAALSGGIGYTLSDIIYMIQTAFTGAFITCLGLYSFSDGVNDVGDLVFGPFRRDQALEYMLIGTVLLGLLGFCIQWARFKSKNEIEEPEEKVCDDVDGE